MVTHGSMDSGRSIATIIFLLLHIVLTEHNEINFLIFVLKIIS